MPNLTSTCSARSLPDRNDCFHSTAVTSTCYSNVQSPLNDALHSLNVVATGSGVWQRESQRCRPAVLAGEEQLVGGVGTGRLHQVGLHPSTPGSC